MQTLVAFAFDTAVPPDRVAAGLARVDAWYGPRWGAEPRTHLATADRLGVHLWADPAEQCRWPAWASSGSRTVASLYAPVGYERLVVPGGGPAGSGAAPDPDAPLALAARLRARPADVLRLTPPFVLAELDAATSTLTLLTDGLGLGRLHEVRTPEGWFWSNRPVAALLFAGVRAEADVEGWRRLAACDWAMGDASPYAGVRVVPAGSRIEADRAGIRAEARDVLAELAAGRREPLGAASLDATAAALTEVTTSVESLWPGVPVLSLSGGRDSRLVVAAFLAAGHDIRLTTYGAATGEAGTARQLVDLLPTPVPHEVTVPAAQRPGPRTTGAYERARRWHAVTEGLRPALYLRGNAPQRLLRHNPPLICGVGGEFGHAPGYPDDVEHLERLPLDRRLEEYTRALQAKITLPRGIAPHAVEAAVRQIRRVLDHAAERGVTDAKALDWFYADERLRRFGMAGESPGRVMPLLVPEFVSAAFGLSTAQSRDSALHTALIERLVPQWRGVPYYSATLGERQAVRQQRLWEETDADLLTDLVHSAEDWGEAFDVPRVQAVWHRARDGRAAPRDELLLQRVVWRAAFTDHLRAVNGTPPLERPRTVVAAPASPAKPAPARRRSAVLVLATWANEVPLARRLARTPLGRRARRWLGA